MKINCSKILVYLIILGFILPISGLVKADIYRIDAGDTLHLSKSLNEGDVITWDWHTSSMDDGLDFWIEDSSGGRYKSLSNLYSYSDSFTVPHDGTWYVKWKNDNLITPVTLEYDVTFGDIGSITSIIFLFIILILVVIAIAGIASAAGKKKQTSVVPPPPPVYSQPAQQTQYQQPQQYCQSCGRAIPPGSILCPYCGGK